MTTTAASAATDIESWWQHVYLAVHALATTVAPTLGPAGRDQMLQSPVGALLLTNTGSTIVRELRVTHPVASQIRHALEAHTARVGDASTRLLLMLRALVDELDAYMHECGCARSSGGGGGASKNKNNSTSSSADSNVLLPVVEEFNSSASANSSAASPPSRSRTTRAHTRGCASACASRRSAFHRALSALQTLQCEWFYDGTLARKLHSDVAVRVSLSRERWLESVTPVLRTMLYGKFSPLATATLVELLTDAIASHDRSISYADALHEDIDLARICAHMLDERNVIRASPAHVTQSMAVPGVLLDGTLAGAPLPPPHAEQEQEREQPLTHMLLLSHAFDRATHDATVRITDAAQLKRVLLHAETLAREIIVSLASARCTMIACVETFRDATLQLCADHGITVVHGVPDDDMKRLSRYLQSNVHDAVPTGAAAASASPIPSMLATAQYVRPLTVGAGGSRTYLHVFSENAMSAPLSAHQHTLVVAAPTDGMCRQYEAVVWRALCMLHAWACARDDEAAAAADGQPASPAAHVNRPLSVVGGAGSAELTLHVWCRNEAQRRRGIDDSSALAYRLVSAALLAVPYALFTNSQLSESSASPARFLQVAPWLCELHSPAATAHGSFGLLHVQGDAYDKWLGVGPSEQAPSSSSSSSTPPVHAFDHTPRRRIGRTAAQIDRELARALPASLVVADAIACGVHEPTVVLETTLAALLALTHNFLRVESWVHVRSRARSERSSEAGSAPAFGRVRGDTRAPSSRSSSRYVRSSRRHGASDVSDESSESSESSSGDEDERSK